MFSIMDKTIRMLKLFANSAERSNRRAVELFRLVSAEEVTTNCIEKELKKPQRDGSTELL